MEGRKRSSIRAAGEDGIRTVGEPYILGMLARTASRNSGADEAIPAQIIGDGIVPFLSCRWDGQIGIPTAVDPAGVILRQKQCAKAQLFQIREAGRAVGGLLRVLERRQKHRR